MLDRFDCYELCVQSPRHIVAMLESIHGNEPLILREDFCGTAAVARRWVVAAPDRQAIAIDLDPHTLDKARELLSASGEAHKGQVRFASGDCIGGGAQAPHANDAADVIFVGNFSIGYIEDRATLVRYLAACKARLNLGNGGFGGGVFCCDIYGGASAFRLGGIERRHPSRGKEIIRYQWLHECADPRTAMVVNSISFRVELDGEIVQELPRAFVYSWRLWSLRELTDAMLEAGFGRVEIYKDLNIAPGEPATAVQSPEELGEDWVVLVAAR